MTSEDSPRPILNGLVYRMSKDFLKKIKNRAGAGFMVEAYGYTLIVTPSRPPAC